MPNATQDTRYAAEFSSQKILRHAISVEACFTGCFESRLLSHAARHCHALYAAATPPLYFRYDMILMPLMLFHAGYASHAAMRLILHDIGNVTTTLY